MTSELKELQNSVFFGGVREIIGDIISDAIISVGEDDGRIQLINLEDLVAGSNQKLEEISNEGIKAISFGAGGNILFCGGESNALFQMNWPYPENISKIYETPENILRITSGNIKGENVAFLCNNDTIYILNFENKNLLKEIPVETGVLWLSMNPTGEYLAYVSGDMNLFVLEINENEVNEIMKTKLIESKYSNEQLINKDERNKLDLPVVAASWGNPYYLLVGNDQESSFVRWFDIKQQKEMKVNIPEITTPIKLLAISFHLMVSVITIENILHTFRLPAYNGEECQVPVIITHKLQNKMTCMNWLGRVIISGDEDGDVYKWTISTPGEDNEEKVNDEENEEGKNDFLSSEDDEQEKAPQQTKPKQATMEGFGSLKSTMKDTYISTKKVVKKAKSNAKQQKLNLTAAPVVKPKSTIETPSNSFIAPKKPVADLISSSEDEIENPETQQATGKSFISDDDEIENVSYTQQQKEFQEQEKKKMNFLDSEDEEENPKTVQAPQPPSFIDSDSDAASVPPPSSVTDTAMLPFSTSEDDNENEKNTKQKKIDFLDSDSDQASVPPPTSVTDTAMFIPSSDDDMGVSQGSNSRSNYVESFTSLFMPTATSKDQDLNISILCWNQYYCMVKGQDDVGVQYIRLYRQQTGIQLLEIDGPEATESTIGCTSENSLLLVSSNSFYYRQFYIANEDDDDAHPEDDGETTYETHGSSENGESYTLCAIGKDWFALISNANRLYIYDKIGNLNDILTLDSRPITMVGHEDLLLLVTGGFHKFELLDISNSTILAKGFLAGKQPLRWIGFDATTDELFSQSGDNVIYCLPGNKGSYWTPYYDINKEFSSLADKYYTVFVDGHKINGYLYKEESTIFHSVPHREYDVYRLMPQTLDPKDAPYTIKSDANDEILYKLFVVNVDARNSQKAVQIANLITNEEIKNAAINYALSHNSLPVAQRINEAMEDQDEENIYYKNKRIEKVKFMRTQPPPEPEQEESGDEEETRAAIIQKKKAQQEEKKKQIEESEETKKRKSFFSQAPIKPKMDSEDELLNDLESAPVPKRKSDKQKSSSSKKKRSKKGADNEEGDEEQTPKKKTKRAPRKKRGADDSTDEEPDEVEEVATKKKSKKPKKARRGADDSTESESEPRKKGADDSTDEDEEPQPAKTKSKAKPKKKTTKTKGIKKAEGVADISMFGFTKK